jgi:hypothetical protein
MTRLAGAAVLPPAGRGDPRRSPGPRLDGGPFGDSAVSGFSDQNLGLHSDTNQIIRCSVLDVYVGILTAENRDVCQMAEVRLSEKLMLQYLY